MYNYSTIIYSKVYGAYIKTSRKYNFPISENLHNDCQIRLQKFKIIYYDEKLSAKSLNDVIQLRASPQPSFSFPGRLECLRLSSDDVSN